MSRRGRPFKFPALANLEVGESVVVITDNSNDAEKTAATLKRKYKRDFEVTNNTLNNGWLDYKRVA